MIDSFVMLLFINSICDYFNLPWQNKYVTKFSANVAKNLNGLHFNCLVSIS